MKPNTVFKRAYNRGLVRLGEFALASDIGSETSWARALSVSRTTVRSVLAAFAAAGLTAYEGRSKTLLRHPVPADFRPETDAGHVGPSSASVLWTGSCAETADRGSRSPSSNFHAGSASRLPPQGNTSIGCDATICSSGDRTAPGS